MALIGTFEKRITNRNRNNNERLVRNEKVGSSSLPGSTIHFIPNPWFGFHREHANSPGIGDRLNLRQLSFPFTSDQSADQIKMTIPVFSFQNESRHPDAVALLWAGEP